MAAARVDEMMDQMGNETFYCQDEMANEIFYLQNEMANETFYWRNEQFYCQVRNILLQGTKKYCRVRKKILPGTKLFLFFFRIEIISFASSFSK